MRKDPAIPPSNPLPPLDGSRPRLRPGDLIIFDGDSMTNRRSAGNPDTWPFLRLMNWDKPWPDLMAEILFCWCPELELRFFNAASAGSTARGLAERFQKNVLDRSPQWVVASVAGNDLRVGVPLAEYQTIMTDYARRLRAQGSQVLFFAVSQHGPDYPKGDTLEGRNAYYAILRQIAEDHPGVYYADIGPSLASKARALRRQSEFHTLYGDTGHFNAVGHLLVAGEILRVFGIVRE